MRRLSNNAIAAFMVFLMIASLISTTLISFYVEKKATTTGKAVSQTGTVGVIVNDTGGGGGAGGGGGGRGSFGGVLAINRTHILDFRIRDDYTFDAGKDDIIIAVFNISNYTFIVDSASPLETKLSISSKTFLVNLDVTAKLDLDLDGFDDLYVYYNNFEYKFIAVYPSKPLPIISIEKKFERSPQFFRIQQDDYTIILVILILIISLVLYIQFRSFRKHRK